MADGPTEHHRAVLDAMRRAACAPADPAVIVFDGRLHRFRVEGDHRGSRNGWLVLHDDGLPAGVFGSWRTGQPHRWRAEGGEALTPEQRRREERRIKEARAQRAVEERSRREQARVRAGSLWAQARPAEDDHPYLREKQAPALGLRQMKDRLVAPVRDLDGALHSLAFINPEGEKRFLTDGAVEGHCHVLGDLYHAHAMLLCEGYATGASLHQASGWPVVVCFNRANLLPVARAVHRRYPDAALVIAGDDDRYTPGNPGRRDAEEAAEEVGGSVILPDFAGLDTAKKPTDFNDLQVLGGLPRLKASLQRRLADVWPDSARSPETPARPVEPGRRAGRGLDGETTEPEGEHDMDNDLNPMPIPPVLAMAAPARRKAPLGAHSNLYQEVTDRIVEMIESGTAPWRRPWDRPRHPGAPTRPVNAATGKFYNGINVLLLHAHLMTLDDPRWCGYEQAKARGWQVKAGARGASIYFFKRLEIDAARDPDGEPLLDEDGAPLKRSLPLLRRHTVFHASQIEGMPSLEEAYGPVDAWPDHRWDAEDRLEALLHRSGAHLVHEGSIAYYHPREDRIVLPPCERFPDPAAYYGVAFHELGHWTGHATRLNRPLVTRRDSPEYAREELRAELASAFLGAELGIRHDLESHAAYLDAYLDLLRQDHREIFRAARDAQGIADLILDRHPIWQLQQGACVARTDPLPDETPIPVGAVHSTHDEENAPAADAIPRTPRLESADPVQERSGAAETAPPLAPPFRWAAAALRELEQSGADGGALGRLARRIDAALPMRAAPVPTRPAASAPPGAAAPVSRGRRPSAAAPGA